MSQASLTQRTEESSTFQRKGGLSSSRRFPPRAGQGSGWGTAWDCGCGRLSWATRPTTSRGQGGPAARAPLPAAGPCGCGVTVQRSVSYTRFAQTRCLSRCAHPSHSDQTSSVLTPVGPLPGSVGNLPPNGSSSSDVRGPRQFSSSPSSVHPSWRAPQTPLALP